MVSIWILPIVFVVFSYVMMAISSSLYNVLAKWLGGVTFTLAAESVSSEL